MRSSATAREEGEGTYGEGEGALPAALRSPAQPPAVEALRLPADLARVVAAWPELAPGLKTAILAILASAGK
jgi:hypothetical protein